MTEEEQEVEQRGKETREIKLSCPECKELLTFVVEKKTLHQDKGGLLSGIFIHNTPDGEEHGLLIYFDADLLHRGTVFSPIQRKFREMKGSL